MNVGDKVLVEATVTAISGTMVAVSISRDGRPDRVEHVRTHPSQVQPVARSAANVSAAA